MPSSLSKNDGLTLFVTHENHSMSLMLFVSVIIQKKKKKTKVKKFTKTRPRDLHIYSHVRYPIGQGVLEY